MAQSEDEKRKEVADRFQSGINEIQTQLNDYLEKNNKLREENQMLADKLQKFIADHEKRESYVQKLLKTRELEAKLAEAKAVQARAVQEQAVLREKRETERALEECSLLKQRLEAHQLVEEKLKEQANFSSHSPLVIIVQLGVLIFEPRLPSVKHPLLRTGFAAYIDTSLNVLKEWNWRLL
ncbi:Beta-taxilin [Echinococcus granulosus]|uniref:Beta-taxilin n=1 Tax=Echinococcus granulosus TaxID=6210 RepID=W6UTL3_ECHGR|nr:Beta-taxilin [Echinococcus granulosus]EUB61717.1 Beta-taxilin [Echinococcus granulosus]